MSNDSDVPSPEADWEPATEVSPFKRNPVTQFSIWQHAMHEYKVIAGLRPQLVDLAARLRLEVEKTWEDLGQVDVAMFRVQKFSFALSRMETGPSSHVFVWVDREGVDDPDAALDLLLTVLGLSGDSVAFRE
jgi:hypothetical protein